MELDESPLWEIRFWIICVVRRRWLYGVKTVDFACVCDDTGNHGNTPPSSNLSTNSSNPSSPLNLPYHHTPSLFSTPVNSNTWIRWHEWCPVVHNHPIDPLLPPHHHPPLNTLSQPFFLPYHPLWIQITGLRRYEWSHIYHFGRREHYTSSLYALFHVLLAAFYTRSLRQVINTLSTQLCMVQRHTLLMHPCLYCSLVTPSFHDT